MQSHIFSIDFRCHLQCKSQLYLRNDTGWNFSKINIIFISGEPLKIIVSLYPIAVCGTMLSNPYVQPVTLDKCSIGVRNQKYDWIWVDLSFSWNFSPYTLLPWLMKHCPINAYHWPQCMKTAHDSIYGHLLSQIICWGHVSLACHLEWYLIIYNFVQGLKIITIFWCFIYFFGIEEWHCIYFMYVAPNWGIFFRADRLINWTKESIRSGTSH